MKRVDFPAPFFQSTQSKVSFPMSKFTSSNISSFLYAKLKFSTLILIFLSHVFSYKCIYYLVSPDLYIKYKNIGAPINEVNIPSGTSEVAIFLAKLSTKIKNVEPSMTELISRYL